MDRDSKGRFVKGAGGRPKGAKNVLPKKAKGFLIDFLEEDQTQAVQDWLKLSAWERWQLRSRLYEFIVPKLARSESILDVGSLSDEEVDKILTRALELPDKRN